MKKIDKKVMKNLLEHKGQYIAITILITIGITIFLAFDMAVYNLQDTVETYYKQYNLADGYLYAVNADSLLDKTLEINGVENAQVRGEYEGKIVFKNDFAKLKILSITNSINKLYISHGDKDTQLKEDEIYLFNKFAKARNINVGDKHTFRLQGKEYNLKVKGLVYSPEFIYLSESDRDMVPHPKDYGVAYLSNKLMKKIYGNNYNNQIIVKTNDQITKDKLKKSLKNIAKESKAYPGIVIAKDEQFAYRAAEEEIKQEINMAQSMPVLFLIIAAIIMAVIIARMVENERTEIGVLKALGYSNKHILLSYIKLTIIVGTMGALFGMLFGAMSSYQFTKVYTKMFEIPILVYNFDVKYLIIALIMAVVLAILAGMYGARKILKLVPQESMRPKSPQKGKKMLFDNTSFYKKLKYTNKMVLRNISRNKKRFILTIIGIAISFVMLLTPFAFYSLMNKMFIDQYKKVQIMDYDVKFDKIVNKEEIKKINSVTNKYTEGYLEMPIDINHNNKKSTISLLGINKNTKVYNVKNINGEKIQFEKGKFYLSNGFAKTNNIKKGDKINIELLFEKGTNVTVKVDDIIDQKFGSNAYMTIEGLLNVFDFSNIVDIKDNNIYTGAYIQGTIEEDKVENLTFVKSIFSTQKMIDAYKNFTELIFFGLGMLVIFGGIIAFVIIYIVSIININERKREFSTLSVLGLTKKEIYNTISKENTIAALIGILLGIPLGISVINYMSHMLSNDMYSLAMEFSSDMFIYASIFTILFVIIGQSITKNKINKLNFLEALKQRMS